MSSRSNEPPQNSPWDEALDWLLALQENPHDALLRAQLQVWLARDERHRSAYREAQLIWDASASAVNPPRRLRRRRPLAALATTALVACAACLCVLLLPLAEYRTGYGEVRELQLQDGSKVMLNTNSRFDVLYDQDLRAVRLHRGEAFFDVAKNAAKPFVVRVGDTEIQALGTRFNVSRRGQALRIDMEEGKVSVRDLADDQYGPLQLRAQDSARRDSDGNPFHISQVAADRIGAWRRGQLVVSNMSVAEAVASIGYYRKGFVWVTDARLARQSVTGVFNTREPLEALRAIVRPFNGKVREDAPYLVTVSAAAS